MTKKILITGANGQLGHEMRNALKGNNRFECIFTDVAELDICNAEAVKQIIADNHIDYIVNCAAYTQVDKAEDNAELCKKPKMWSLTRNRFTVRPNWKAKKY